MLSSPLFRKALGLILGVVLVNALAAYFLAAPLIRDSAREAGLASAMTILGNVAELVRVQALNLTAYRDAALEARRRQMRGAANMALEMIASYRRSAAQGRLDLEEARRQALDALSRLRFGEGEYVFVIDASGLVLSHPDPRVLGKDSRDVTASERPLSDILAEVAENGGAFARYRYERLGGGEPADKLAYLRRVPDWNWIVGAGSYLDDVEAETDRRKTQMIEELRRVLSNIAVAGSGYVFIMDGRGEMIAHPALAGSNFLEVLDPATGRSLAREIMEAAAADPPLLRYKWDRPENKGVYEFDKIALVKRNPDFDWYIASTVYEEELAAGAALLRNRLFGLSAILMLVSVLGAAFFAGRILAPLRALSEAAGRIRDGELSARCAVRGEGELQVLSAVFNDMAAALESQLGRLDEKARARSRELAEKNVRLKLQIAERKRVEEDLRRSQSELRAAQTRAEQASRAKSGFLANLSHEIRTPLNAVMGMSALVLAGALSERQREFMNIIRASARDLLEIVGGVLDFSKIEAGKIELDERPFNLRRLLGEIADMFAGEAREKGLDFLVEARPDVPETVLGDPVKLKQILVNLTNNAIRHTDAGAVILTASPAPVEAGIGPIAFTVCDTGVGVDPKDLPGLFEPFAQAESTRSARRGGAGLGLAISRRLAEVMGGAIDARSEPGRGSSFTLTAPLAPLHGEDGELKAILEATAGKSALVAVANGRLAKALSGELGRLGLAAQTVRDASGLLDALADAAWSPDLVLLESALFTEETAAALRRPRNAPGPALAVIDPPGGERRPQGLEPGARLFTPVKPSALRDMAARLFLDVGQERFEGGMEEIAGVLEGARILLAEDIEVNRQVAVEILRMAGVEPDVAENGREAVTAAARNDYDAVLMDLQMPVMDGFAATAAIRAMPRGAGLPIVAMTAYALEGDRQRCLEAGMDEYLTKPLDWRSLITVLRRRVGPRRPACALPLPPGKERNDPAATADATARAEAWASGPCATVAREIDFEEGLARLGGQSPVYRRVLRLFAGNYAAQAAKIRDCLDEDDPAGARAKTHALAGAAGNLGAGPLRLTAKRLEELILAKDWDAARQALAALEASLTAVLAAIESYAPPGEEAGGKSGETSDAA